MGEPKTVFYAHCIDTYDTEQEQEDLAALKAMGFKVFNPNCENYRKAYEEKGMSASEPIIKGCDAVAFRAVIAGDYITSGVGAEIAMARRFNKPVIEIPHFSSIIRRVMSRDTTKTYLKDIGVR